MTLNMGSPSLSHPSPFLSKLSVSSSKTSAIFSLLFGSNSQSSAFKPPFSISSGSRMNFEVKASLGGNRNGIAENHNSALLDDDLLARVSAAKDANEALEMIGGNSKRPTGGVVGTSDCCSILIAALERNNAHLALSIFSAMRSSFDQGVSNSNNLLERWKWSRPDIRIYTTLIGGLAASLRISDALRLIADVCRVGVSPGEEVPFGKIVRCPRCLMAVAVAQPQHGIQIVSCSKCRYQYELVSGDIVSIESQEISMDVPAWERTLNFLQIMKESSPAAVHSIVVQIPSGMARTHRFATKTVDLPAREGERVTIASAAPSSVFREVGPFKFSPKDMKFYPGEPLSLTNHRDGRESLLLRAPLKNGSSSLLNPSTLFPLLAVLATGDAASGIIDPNLPRFISVAAVASFALGATINTVVLPQLNQLSQKSVEAIAIKQQLLSQYDTLQSRIENLKGAAEKEVWTLARMCQLENKIVVVGEPSYRARRRRVKKVRESLENSLRGRIELIDSYARISSMIEIEVEMGSDVLAAEAASNAESIAEQIEQIMELESLEEKWRVQVEANDEVERLLSSEPIPTEESV
ncbi:uncharacterized protein LOC131151918 [Malania oleifera]|uniref:uncharacterized protein LOC131151918 n=1 Tax=Malania oleifera TaxID=397392 RepID=UPI0025AE33C6|nr:uncharacterized protein LOC131151918 [Malania oleifera]